MSRQRIAARHSVWLALLLCGWAARDAAALGIPLERIEGDWMPARADDVQITSWRLEIYPSMDDDASSLVWMVDETMVLRNGGSGAVELNLGVPNGWSEDPLSVTEGAQDFWAEAYINGTTVETDLVEIIRNPAEPEVGYHVARQFAMSLGPGEAAHVRLRFALPAESVRGEQTMLFPMRLRPLYDGPIEAAVLVLRWSEQMYGFRTNLPSYGLYNDRAEWFVRGFEPTSDFEVRFLSRTAVFSMVAERVGCPMPWELMDRVGEGTVDPVREMLAPYTVQQLEICAELPAALRGSRSAARAIGLDEWTLDQFAPADSGISGPLFIANPTFREDELSDSEALYGRFLRQEVASREAYNPSED